MLNIVPFMGKKVRVVITSGSELDTLDGVLMYDHKLSACYMDFHTDFSDYRLWINPDYVVTIREDLT